MKKLALLAMVLGIGGVIGISSFASADDKPAPCHRTEFKTQLIHDACLGADGKGGSQKAAKDAMKQFLKDNKSKMAGLDCTTCHAKLAPEYPLKGDGSESLKTFEKLGGKLLAAKP